MEHVKISPYKDGFFSLRAENGYRLFDTASQRFFSEAVVKPNEVKNFKSVKV